MAPQQAVGNGVEGAAPELAGICPGEGGDSLQHFAGGFVGEGEQQNAPGGHAVLQQPGYAVGEGAGLAAAGTGNDECLGGGGGDGGVLLRVQFCGVVVHDVE